MVPALSLVIRGCYTAGGGGDCSVSGFQVSWDCTDRGEGRWLGHLVEPGRPPGIRYDMGLAISINACILDGASAR